MYINATQKTTNSTNFKGTFLVKGDAVQHFNLYKKEILNDKLKWNYNINEQNDSLILTTKYDILRPIDKKIRNEVTKNKTLFLTFKTTADNVFNLYNLFDFNIIKKLTKLGIEFDYTQIKLNKDKYPTEKAYQRDFDMLFQK